MCCIFSSEPIEDPTGRFNSYGDVMFQKSMMEAPCSSCSNFGWFFFQFVPLTCICTQVCLRRKVLDYDMTKYSCFQGQFDCCCVKSGECGEQNCPNLCLCIEATCCNGLAVSASRNYMMARYNLHADPCDYRLIRLNNFLQVLSCICNIAAIFINEIRDLARIIDWIAELCYHCVSGCMTAQTANEVDYQKSINPTAEGLTTQNKNIHEKEQVHY